MDKNENYAEKYSFNHIYDTGMSLSAIKDMLGRLEKTDWTGKFGLGCVQWTGGRTKTLVESFYMKQTSKDTITKDEAAKAEGLMIVNELRGKHYKAEVYDVWKAGCNGNTNTETAARNAGVVVCKKYEKPKVDSSEARGETSVKVYKVMMKGN